MTIQSQTTFTKGDKMTKTKLTWVFRFIAGLLFGRTSYEERHQTVASSGAHASLPKMGIFIDFDNIKADAVSLILNHLSPHWNMTCRRAYGSGTAKHKTAFHTNGVLPIEVLPNTPGKNSTDIALVIDVVLAVCSGIVDAFCIVSSDGDYTRLALMIREKGKRVLVVGRSTTPKSLRSACSEFIDLDDLRGTLALTATPNSRSSSTSPSNAENSGLAGELIKPEAPIGPQSDTKIEHSCAATTPVQIKAADLIHLIRELTGDRGKTTLKAINAKCSRRYANFSPKMCGSRRWLTLLRTMTVFTIEPIRNKHTGQIQDYAVGFRPAVQGRDVLTS